MVLNRILSDEFRDNLFNILHGDVVGYTYRRNRAYSHEPSTSFYSTVWSFNNPSRYPYLAAAQTLKASSTSVNDTAAGTGARTIFIDGLDANYNFISEIVTLNGQTPVDTVNSYLRINNISCLTFGSLLYNDGHISVGSGIVTLGANDKPQGFISAKIVYSDTGVITVPNGYTVVIYGNEASVKAGKDASIRVTQRSEGSSTFVTRSTIDLFGSSRNFASDNVIKFIDERSDIEFQAIGDSAKAAVSIETQFVFIDNKYI